MDVCYFISNLNGIIHEYAWLLEELLGTDFLCAGYSAASAVLAPNLNGVEIIVKQIRG
jgi:hypothetical protein